ncbi:MBL fold metallo-hydrolase, partial [Corynebacterium sp. ACRPH]|nr:MBL fold metallo-hydrolase [Corynebacterium sp. ACRPH]
MELVVLGCSGSVEGPDSAASGYIVRDTITANPDHLLLDCGPGVLSAMQRAEDIDPSACHVAFSHMHADHCLDFPSLLVWRRFHPTAPSTQRHQLF